MTILLKLIRYFLGSIFFAYGFLCLLGGPDPGVRGGVEGFIIVFVCFTFSCLFFMPEIKEIVNLRKKRFPDIMNSYQPYKQKNCPQCCKIVDVRATICLSCGESLSEK